MTVTVSLTNVTKYSLTSGSEYGPPEALADVITSQYISEDVSFTEYDLFCISKVDFSKTVSFADAILPKILNYSRSRSTSFGFC